MIYNGVMIWSVAVGGGLGGEMEMVLGAVGVLTRLTHLHQAREAEVRTKAMVLQIHSEL